MTRVDLSRRSERELAGDLIFGVFDILAERQKRKKLVTAGNAAKSRNAEDSPQRRAERIGVFGGDTLQLQIAANRTMGAQHMT